MSELIFLSRKTEAYVFSALGFDVHIINELDEVQKILNSLDRNVKIIGFDPELKPVMDKYKDKKQTVYPILLELPLDGKETGSKVLEVKESIKKSIGIDLL
ncbi:MAG: hypothetical protein WC964_04110 [Acholeplasmataceae bacterium]